MQPAEHEANGFGHRYLHEWKARALYQAGYMTPSDLRLPCTWLSAGEIPIALVPHDAARSAAIHQHFYEGLTAEQRNDPV
jgi:hypothetical protein